MVVDPVPVEETVKLILLRPIAPLNTAVLLLPLFPIVMVPTADDPRLMLLETVTELANKLAEQPLLFPKVIASPDGPPAPLTVVALLTLATTVPQLTFKPPV